MKKIASNLLVLIIVLAFVFLCGCDSRSPHSTLSESEKIIDLEIKEESVLTTMRVNLEEERQDAITVLQEKLTDEKLSTEEKNNVYEELKYLNEIEGKEENLEKSIKKELKLDCFVKQDKSNIETVCVSNEHDNTLANKIMRLIQSNYENKMYITVKFQKK